MAGDDDANVDATVATEPTTSVKYQRAPPVLKLEVQSYVMWKRDVEIWKLLTSLPANKQGLDLYMSLDQKFKAFVNLPVSELSAADGVDKLVKKLDEILLRDKDTLAFEAFENFDGFFKTVSMSMVEYVNKFDQLYNKAAEYQLTMGSSVLACLLLKHASLSDNDIKIVRSSLQALDYPTMKKQLLAISEKNVLSARSQASSSRELTGPQFLPPPKKIKQEESFDEEVHWNSSEQNHEYRGGNGGRGGFRGRGGYSGRGGRGRGRGGGRNGGSRQNPIDRETGNITKCFKCGSTNHYVQNCDQNNNSNKDKQEGDGEALMTITLMANAEENSDVYDKFIDETQCEAVVDTACTKTCAGEQWVECYTDTLSPEERKNLVYSKSDRRYKFGSGDPVTATKCVKLPCSLAGVDVHIETNIVPSNIPLLLSKESMKKARMVIDTGNDTAEVFGRKVKLNETSSGHYCLNISKTLEKLNNNQIALYCSTPLQEQDDKQLKVSALKLHRQFGHVTPEKLKKLIMSAGEGSDRLLNAVDVVAENCDTCKRFKRAPPRPVVSIPMGTKFLEVVAMDLKHWRGNTWILHLIDTYSRFSGGYVVNNKFPDTIIKGIFECWIKFLGVPGKFLTDNGGEFVNNDFMDMADNLNIHVMTTPAEAPWCNGVVEKHNHIIGVMLEKLWEDGLKDIKQNLSWCLNAKNSMENHNGFTPYQIALGTNPILPNYLNSQLPALEGVTNSERVAKQMQLMHECRKAFTQAESSEKLRRALRSNTRTYTDNDVNIGDLVYFKRKDSDRYRGTAKVIGKDGKNVILKYGGLVNTVHLCRVVKVEDAEQLLCEEGNTEKQCENIDNVDNTDVPCSEIDVPLDDGVSPTVATHSVIETIDPLSVPSDTMNVDAGNVSQLQTGQGVDKMTGSTLPKKNTKIKYKLPNESDWKVVDVIDKHKPTSKYKNYVNVLGEDDMYEIDWEQVEEWAPVQEEVFFTQCPQIDDAKLKELQRWSEYDVFEVVPDNGEKTVDTRWVVTEKTSQDGTSVIKARLVAKGFQEPSKLSIRKDSPTALKTSLRLATTYIASQGWDVKSFDISAAFLQGEEIGRKILVKPPPEANCKGLWLLRKPVYGLVYAPRKFYLKMRKELTQSGMVQSKADPALFFWRLDEKLHGVVVAHVDDFFYGGTDRFTNDVMKGIKSKFSLSSECVRDFRYVGFKVKQHDDKITFNQSEYLKDIKPISVSKERESMTDQPLSREEQLEMKRRCGQLNWLSTHTRPDIAFDLAELSGRTSSLKVSDVTKMNKLITKLKNSDIGIVYPRMKDVENLRVAVFADASLGNLPDKGSQAGYLVFLVDCEGNAALIDWKSHKIRRIVRSTLAAETLSMSDAVDAAMLIASTWNEFTGCGTLDPVECITDCHSLYDNVNSTKLCTEKRLRIDIAMLKEMQERGEMVLHWTDTKEQLADPLTKKGVSTLNLLKVVSTGHL